MKFLIGSMDLLFNDSFENLLQSNGFCFCSHYCEHLYKRTFTKGKIAFQNDRNSVKVCLGSHIIFWKEMIPSEMLASIFYFSSLTQQEKSFFKRLRLVSVNEFDCHLLYNALTTNLNDIYWLDTKLYRTYRYLHAHLENLKSVLQTISEHSSGTKSGQTHEKTAF